MDKLQAQMGKSGPQLQELMNLPGAAEARGLLTRGLAQRAAARFLKLVLGPAQPRRSRQLQPKAVGVPKTLPPAATAGPTGALSLERMPLD